MVCPSHIHPTNAKQASPDEIREMNEAEILDDMELRRAVERAERKSRQAVTLSISEMENPMIGPISISVYITSFSKRIGNPFTPLQPVILSVMRK